MVIGIQVCWDRIRAVVVAGFNVLIVSFFLPPVKRSREILPIDERASHARFLPLAVIIASVDPLIRNQHPDDSPALLCGCLLRVNHILDAPVLRKSTK